MKRSEFWQKIWIPITRNIPPKDTRKFVLIWNYKWEEPIVMSSLIAHCGAEAMKKGDEIGVEISEDRVFSHWCFIEGPKS